MVPQDLPYLQDPFLREPSVNQQETELHTMSRVLNRFVALDVLYDLSRSHGPKQILHLRQNEKLKQTLTPERPAVPKLVVTSLPRNLHDAVAEEEHLGGLHCGSCESHGARDHRHDARGVACNLGRFFKALMLLCIR